MPGTPQPGSPFSDAPIPTKPTPAPASTSTSPLATSTHPSPSAPSTSRPTSSHGAPAPSSPSAKKRPHPTTSQLHLDQYLTRDNLHSSAIISQSQSATSQLRQKSQEAQFYRVEVRQTRQRYPSAIFGPGYSGYGNGFTDGPSRVVYPCQRKRPGGRKARELRISREKMAQQAEAVEELVPIRLEVEGERVKLRDTFTWNLHERAIPLDVFVETLVEDFHLPPVNAPGGEKLQREILNSVTEQLSEYHPHIFSGSPRDEALDPNLPYTAYKNDDMRVLIKLNITIGQHTLVDQFEWDINNPQNCPEEFATLLTREMSLSGEFTTAIAHSIREQVQLFTKALYVTGHPFDGRPIEDEDVKSAMLPSPPTSILRPHMLQKEFSPTLYEMSEHDLDRAEKTRQREDRVRKRPRGYNRRGAPTIPDLREMPKTQRTQIVSSVLPGAIVDIESLEEKRARNRGKLAGEMDSDEDMGGGGSSEDDDELPPEKAIPGFATMTKRQRQAAIAARQNQQAAAGRSITPDTTAERTPTRKPRIIRDHSTPHHEETPKLHPGTPQMQTAVLITPPGPTTPVPGAVHHPSGLRRAESIADPTPPPPPLPRRPGCPPNQESALLILHFTNIAALKSTISAAAERESEREAAAHRLAAERQKLDREAADREARPPHKPQKRPTSNTMPPPPAPATASPTPTSSTPASASTPTSQEPTPEWLTRALNTLNTSYPNDRFEGTMRWTATNSQTGQVVLQANINDQNRDTLRWKWMPRIRCSDCPGKWYTPGPGEGVENFVMHLKNRGHRERVEGRLAKEKAEKEGGGKAKEEAKTE